MRRFVMFGLLLSLVAFMSSPLPAQTLKSEPKTEPEIKWPKEILGKTLEQWTREMRESRDASTRDQAIRTIPLFGPDCRKACSANLIYSISKDPDINVRLTAIATVPLIGFDEPFVDQGLNAMTDLLKPTTGMSNHTRYEATMAIGNCGPIAKRAIPTITTYTLVDPTSWQNRKAACYALGRLGAPMMEGEGPDIVAIRGLVKTLRLETSHQVRREAITSIMLLGPPLVEAVWKELREALAIAMTRDVDNSVKLWARVAYIRTEQDLIKPTDPNLAAIAKQTTHTDPDLRQEAVQALGFLGKEAAPRLSDLIAIAQNNKEEPIIVAMAIWAMSQLPTDIDKDKALVDKILPVIEPLQKHVDDTVKLAATTAYKNLTIRPDLKEKDKKDAPPKK